MDRFTKILMVIITATAPLLAFPQFNESREFAKRFKVLPETQIEITNKYGNVEIISWDKDSVVFNIKISVEERKLSKLEKTMEGVDFDFTNSSHFLIARTIVNSSQSTLEREFMKFKESLLQSDGKVEINMTVWLPKKSTLKLDNKFGNIYIGEFYGNSEITLSNGVLKAHEFVGNTKIDLNFADATINNLNSARLITSYSEVEIRNAQSLKIESKQSNFDISEVKEMNVNSRRDKFRVRTINLLEGEGSLTNFRISELNDRLNLHSEYGDLQVENINPDFSVIFIESKSADINLYFNRQSNFGFEITETKTDMDLCREVAITNESVLDEKDKKIRHEGHFGTQKSQSEKLLINALLGRINIFSN